MNDAPRLPLLLGLAGSLREQSYSASVLTTLARAIEREGIAHVDIASVDLPLYNQDLDVEPRPTAVATLKQAIDQADALLIVTPEYNHGLPGVLKNALDWASRPMGASPLKGKRVQAVANSPAFTGGVRALAQLHETVLSCGCHLHAGPQVVIGGVAEKIGNGQLNHAPSVEFAVNSVRAMLAHDH
ncbi:NADPH-dependent FMN reductase [Oleiagrimonas sp. C23AA]|uniref:NADPH-dependent FMN reductase n=1 Tax=Oleiagrimonas sp. C23AA TaxID=2719047 RepID=UPI0014236887|nr:NADPH-dependent FMN reductase [Oleiagrimonas sp. C23AA]NII09838.1 NAD(P)H-dependent oxidoreductase [Oleiagrimonas sp. C23AA]